MLDKALETYNKIKNDDEVLHISKVATNQGKLSEPFSIGYQIFDDALRGGVREGDLVVVTGLSGHGKTLFMQHLSINLSQQAHRSIWFSYEVIINNLYAKFKDMGIEDSHLLVYVPKQNTTGHLSWVQEKIVEAQKKYGVKFVFIDHIDYLSPTNMRNTDQYRMMLGQVCQELKTMAIDLKLCIFLAAHVKKVEGRAIEMQDISESSSIYKLADVVFGVTRRKSEIKTEDFDVLTNRGVVRVLKNRVTGQIVYLNYFVENSIIVPETVNVKKEEEAKSEIEVVEDDDEDMKKEIEKLPF